MSIENFIWPVQSILKRSCKYQNFMRENEKSENKQRAGTCGSHEAAAPAEPGKNCGPTVFLYMLYIIIVRVMLQLSKKLAEGIHHIRVDWYVINGKLYFGELTFFDGSGFIAYDDPKNDLLLGSWINLPSDK